MKHLTSLLQSRVNKKDPFPPQSSDQFKSKLAKERSVEFSTKMNPKFGLFLVLLVLGAFHYSLVEAQGTFVDACNEVCNRSSPERKECCRAHGYPLGRRFNCNGGRMICY
ncbi:Diapause-specific peptide [Folsomia candida]|uniref:Diapause-specific peptide n=1 Tax=Folsomia candida TaxID=158441 RepID=A0A226E9K1_FOLCA|nr:Diapause-specific peptide [Folsomia candida]